VYAIDFASETPISKLLEVRHPATVTTRNSVKQAIIIEGYTYFFSDNYVSIYNLATKELSAPLGF